MRPVKSRSKTTSDCDVSMSNSVFKALNRSVGNAIHKYEMIAHNDRILVGLSGGKDSLALLWMLTERRPRVPIDYELIPVYVDPGFSGGFSGSLADFVRVTFGFSLRVEVTDFGIVAHSEANLENPCFLCARRRRQRLFEIADSLGCNKVALGHHKDDLIETFFINILYAGEVSTMLPAQPMFKGLFTLIRPLAFCDEDDIRRFSRGMDFPAFYNPCPSSNKSKRSQIKSLLNGLYRGNPKIKGNVFRAMRHINPEYLLKP